MEIMEENMKKYEMQNWQEIVKDREECRKIIKALGSTWPVKQYLLYNPL